jgi:hypothetical protein
LARSFAATAAAPVQSTSNPNSRCFFCPIHAPKTVLFETVRLRPAFGVPMTNLKCAVIRLLSIHACGSAVALTLVEG